MIRRPPRSTLSSSSAASDVYKRQVHELVPADRRDEDPEDDDADDRQHRRAPPDDQPGAAQAPVVRAPLGGRTLGLAPEDDRRDTREEAEAADERGKTEHQGPDTEAVLLGPAGSVVPGCRGVGRGGRVALLTVRRGLLAIGGGCWP